MRKRNNKKDTYDEFQSFPLFVMLSCGIIVLLIGVYLTLSNNFTQGITLPDKYGNGGGQKSTISGPSAIVIGFLICIFPVFQLIKKSNKKKSNNEMEST